MFHIPPSRPTGERFSNFLHAALAVPFGVIATLAIVLHLGLLL